ncbi:uncharacterized protein PITG_00589 [Phytophthora infestans T30-4]|uniref:Protein preY, mitochondrial n=2 Tax=Phytophthora infestans TaxID=4787 RepID=D0MR72_PHYIT|nr:uncharacterized protein PITG_00589 [Phytophthora infestans T30-4]EEY57991.1 conserved hypothetical protein [Phytophthora infestans T30-4]KAF4040105.1 Trm112p-like protein [Phytophthora infestans]KAF4131680.1 Trm112p-like domain-containing protein [Phytophthora infestans]|eukprot:XP_002909177.1 conserved hypothetical protein [Phytophthora infestans T30-4]
MSSLRGALRPALRALQSSTTSSAPLTLRSMSSASSSRFDRSAKLADESIMEHLVCPISKHPLRYDAERGSLVCDEINVEYPIWQGIPMLVPSEGRIINNDQH